MNKKIVLTLYILLSISFMAGMTIFFVEKISEKNEIISKYENLVEATEEQLQMCLPRY